MDRPRVPYSADHARRPDERLDAYENECEGDWAQGPDDGYFLGHLVDLLLGAERREEVHHLLAREDEAGRNAWHAVRVAQGGASGYLADVQLAWRAAEESFRPGDERTGRQIGLQCRYAILTSAVGSAGGDHETPPTALATLVALAAFAPRLPEPLRTEAVRETWEAARRMEAVRAHQTYTVYRARALAWLTPCLPPDLQETVFWSQAAPAAVELLRIWREYATRLLAELASALSADVVGKVLCLTYSNMKGIVEEQALVPLLPLLPAHRLAKAFSFLDGVADSQPEVARWAGQTQRTQAFLAQALAALAARLPAESRGQALQLTRKVKHEFWRAWALGAMARHLSAGLLEEALEIALDTHLGSARDWALMGLAPHLPEVLLERALEARGSPDERGTSAAEESARQRLLLGSLASLRTQFSFVWDGGETLIALLPHLPPGLCGEMLAEAVALAFGELPGPEMVATIANLAPHLEAHDRGHALTRALAATAEMADGRDRAIVALAASLDDDQLGAALDISAEIEPFIPRAQALAVLQARLLERPPSALHPLWRRLLHRASERSRGDLLMDLAELAPAVARLGGSAATLETFMAIRDAGRWWP